MAALNIAIIVGSTRPGRNGAAVAAWVYEQASERDAAKYEIVDLEDTGLPLLDEAVPALAGAYEHQHTKDGAATVVRFDGFVFVTHEYNHSTPRPS
jgi:NAD(P)H-dependent FMN reductase